MENIDDREFALLHMLRFPELAEMGVKAEEKHLSLFPEMTHSHCKIIWESYLKVAKGLKTYDVTKDLLVKELKDALRIYQSAMTEDFFIKAVTLLGTIARSQKSQMKSSEGKAFLSALIKDELQNSVLDKMRKNPSLEALKKSVHLVDTVEKDVISAGTGAAFLGVQFPLHNIAQYMGKTTKVPFGISFLDRLTGGGCTEGQVFGFLGIQGGGKTMMTVQIAVNFADAGIPVLWCTYEQGFSGDIAERVMARVTGTGLSQIRNKNYSELPPDTLNKFQDFESRSGKFLAVRDFATTLKDENGNELPEDQQLAGDGKDIRAVIEGMIAMGNRPKVLLLDWLGEAVERIAMHHHINISDYLQYQLLATEYERQVLEICKDYNLIGIIFHQISADKKSQPPSWKPSACDAEKFKAFSKDLYGCFVMGTTKVGGSGARYLIMDKYRTGGPRETVIRMVGEEARFVDADGWVIGSNGDFEDPNLVEKSFEDTEEDKQRKLNFAQRVLWGGAVNDF